MKYSIVWNGYAESPFHVIGLDNYVIKSFDSAEIGVNRARKEAQKFLLLLVSC